MRFFNFEQLYLLSHGDPDKLMEVYNTKGHTGNDFIVNPRALMGALHLTTQQKAEFLGICALRSYEYYRATGDPNLSFDLVPPWVSRKVIEANPLITITENKYILKNEGK